VNYELAVQMRLTEPGFDSPAVLSRWRGAILYKAEEQVLLGEDYFPFPGLDIRECRVDRVLHVDIEVDLTSCTVEEEYPDAVPDEFGIELWKLVATRTWAVLRYDSCTCTSLAWNRVKFRASPGPRGAIYRIWTEKENAVANNPRKDREIGSKPDTSKTPIEREVKREVLHPWSKARTHPQKEN